MARGNLGRCLSLAYYNTSMIRIKTDKQIEGIHRSSVVAVATLRKVAEYIRPGVSTQALDDIAVAFMKQNGAVAASLGYRGFPKSICVSVNNVVCHGIPSDKVRLRDGDIVNVDITTVVDGYFGDVSESLAVGEIDEQKQKLLEVTKEAMMLAINSIRPGKKLNQCVGRIIEPYVKAAGLSVVRDLGGHGVGLEFHEEPFVYHFVTEEEDCELVPGMTFTIEPMVNASPDYRVWIDKKDGWTVRTMDGAPSAQFERTVLVTETGVEILTKY